MEFSVINFRAYDLSSILTELRSIMLFFRDLCASFGFV